MIPAGTELHCISCGEIVTRVVGDLPDHEKIRNSYKYLEMVPCNCKSCGAKTDLYQLIVEELCQKPSENASETKKKKEA